MKIIRGIKEMSKFSLKAKLKKQSIGFVPTMGALHQGHLSLLRWAHRENDITVASIFVNPAQFGPGEDFRKYPRTLKKDTLFCEEAGVDIIFYPQAKAIYPDNYKTYVNVDGLSACLCGKTRPGHFRGVATIVTKLFNIVQPDTAYFGAKDAQQAVIIKKMVSDLNMPLEIKVMPTVRDRDGLALSSRNVYLNKNQRQDALVLSKALNLAGSLIKNGLRDTKRIMRRISETIKKKQRARIDYVSIVDLKNLKPVRKVSGGCLIALAVWIGKTRLIDNLIIKDD